MKGVSVILWALAIGLVLVFLGSALLPSTKRGSFDAEQMMRLRESATQPATQEVELKPVEPDFALPGTKSGLVVREGTVRRMVEGSEVPATGPATRAATRAADSEP